MILNGCATPEGTVTGKEHQTRVTHMVADYDKKCTGKGVKRRCVEVFDGMEEEELVPECWKILFVDGDGNNHEACVTQTEYDQIGIGDHFRVD